MSSAWIYCAVSSDKQTEALEDHERWARETAAANGWRVDRVFGNDGEGVGTGKRGIRKVMEALLDELRATPKHDRPKRIILSRIDRFGRGDGLEVIWAIEEVRKLGVMLHTRTRGDLTFKGMADVVGPVFEALQAGFENEVKSDRSKAGHARRKREGKHAGHAPYGTVLIAGKPHPFEPEASIVREIFHKFVFQGWGRHRLGYWATQHAPPKKRADGSTRTLRWSQSSILGLLKCPTHRGLIVDESVWDAAQIPKRGTPFIRSSRFTWPLRGHLKCSCGHALSGHTGSKNKTIRYYACRYTAGHDGKTILHRADELEAQFEALIRSLPERIDPAVLYEDAGANIDGLKARHAALSAELATIETRKARVWEIAERAGIPDSEVSVRLKALADEKTRLQSALGELDGEIAPLERSVSLIASAKETVRGMADLWSQAQDDARREVVSAVCALLGGLHVAPELKGQLLTGEVLTNYRKSTEIQHFVNTTISALRLSAFVQSSVQRRRT